MSIRDLYIKSNLARQKFVEITTKVEKDHLGGFFILHRYISSFYFRVMRYDPQDINWENRDRFILSKGHSAPALYVKFVRQVG